MRADPSRQRRLLDLQALDTRLDQIAHARAVLPVQRELDVAAARADAARAELVRARTALSDVQREVAKADRDVQVVRDRAARDQARLNSGQGSPKDLQALQHELVSLARRQSELEDIELEVMERAEGLAAEVARLEAAAPAVEAAVTELTAARDTALAQLDAEAESIAASRTGAVGEVGEDLLALYEKVRAASGGIGAAALRQRRCEGCRLELNTVDLSRFRGAAPEEVLRCEECRRILVRTAESGL
ncbi:MAG TPA: C4-type zinc ribbon domain-containing protein [Dermatophilaceae bacterium]|nr:C4-type zinc ribbon domain-containing protein [Dermatophilaceae bacterium]